jgi:hypothetical protein
MTVAALAFFAPVAGQDQTAGEQRALLEAKLQIERARVGVESKIVKGAPYSAEAVTETLQILADGNRISRKSVSRIYRDGEGRTRRETLSPAGDVVSINISDPVSESQYVLDPRTKTAHRNGVIMATARGGFASGSVTAGSGGTVTATRTPDGDARIEAKSEEAGQKRELETAAAVGVSRSGGGGGASAGGTAVSPEPLPGQAPMMVRMPANMQHVNKEALGSQIVEGVMATGSRSTTTIEAGAIGNAQPISVVSEQWFSEDLKVLVMTKHSDPRTGETIYRLTNVILAEPARSLFEVPADYALRDSVIRRQSPLKEQ